MPPARSPLSSCFRSTLSLAFSAFFSSSFSRFLSQTSSSVRCWILCLYLARWCGSCCRRGTAQAKGKECVHLGERRTASFSPASAFVSFFWYCDAEFALKKHGLSHRQSDGAPFPSHVSPSRASSPGPSASSPSSAPEARCVVSASLNIRPRGRRTFFSRQLCACFASSYSSSSSLIAARCGTAARTLLATLTQGRFRKS